MDFSGLLSSSDNLFKYLFGFGIFLIMISVFYPLPKEQELDLEINKYNTEVALLNKEINSLESNLKKLNEKSNIVFLELDSLAHSRNNSSSYKKKVILDNEIETLRLSMREAKDTSAAQLVSVERSVIRKEYERSKINILSRYAHRYKVLFYCLFWAGILFAIIGVIFWTRSTILTEKIKKKEYANM